MRKIFVLLSVGLLLTAVAYADSKLPTIFFDTGKADILESEAEKLQEAASIIIDNKLTVIVVGHADPRGDRDYNLDLGEKRSQAVVDRLVELEVPKGSILSVSYGEEKPTIVDNNFFAANRRVQIISAKPLAVKENRKNRISFYGGIGPLDLHKRPVTGGVDIYQSYNPVVGLGYSRLVNDKVSVGIVGFSNATFALSVGLDF